MQVHKTIIARHLLTGAFVIGLSTGVAAQVGPQVCGSLENAYGPYDYRTQRARLGIVEKHHFTSQVELLVRGATSTSLGGDLDYTLRASPNHHRALLSLIRLAERTKTPQPHSFPRPLECYFERALRFRNDDTVARLLYAKFLLTVGRSNESLERVDQTVKLAADNALTHYNAGLLYVELKSYDKAVAQAHVAQKLGHTGTGLREQLQAANQWREPAAETQ